MPNHFINYNVQLFRGMSKEEVDELIECQRTKFQRYDKGSMILNTGDKIKYFGVINKGRASLVTYDEDGNRMFLSSLREGDLFAESIILSGINISPVDLLAETDVEIMYIDYNRLTMPCKKLCIKHMIFLRNLLKIISDKNIYLQNKLRILSKRTLREKILAYIYLQGEKLAPNKYKLHINRAELADYLCVNRSSMIREMSKMVQEGIIAYEGNIFTILKKIY